MGPDKKRRNYAGRLKTMRRRAEFQRLRGGARWSGPAFVVEGKRSITQASDTMHGDMVQVRFGFTITKKLGKAHERNRMRRRLSHALRLVQIPAALRGWDCVIVARPSAFFRPFDALVADFAAALAQLARKSLTDNHISTRSL